jgi:hypothetical protein
VEWPADANQTDLKLLQQELAPSTAIERLPSLDNIRWRGATPGWAGPGLVALRDDGTLWFWNWDEDQKLRLKALSTTDGPSGGSAPVQIGKDSDWTGLARSLHGLVTRKRDGSLWEWGWVFQTYTRIRPDASPPALLPPAVRLGTHSDWVALGDIGGRTLSLAADGSLWIWPAEYPADIGRRENSGQLIGPSRKPAKIENVFGAPE